MFIFFFLGGGSDGFEFRSRFLQNHLFRLQHLLNVCVISNWNKINEQTQKGILFKF